MNDPKIVFTGTPGAGKTTAIRAISDIEPVSTDVANTDARLGKATTTVGLDYGHVDLGEGLRVRLFGTPGQARFDFMWSIIGRQALGLLILIDNSRPDPLADLRLYLDHFGDGIHEMNCAIGVGRTEIHPVPALDAFGDLLESRGLAFPTLAVDVRRRDDVLLLIETILAQAECRP